MREQTTNEDLGSSALSGNDDLVRRTQKMLTAWRSSGNRSKRFRFQNVKAQRNDLSINLTRLFCDNSDYESLQLIQSGINLEKDTTIKILKVRPRPNALYDISYIIWAISYSLYDRGDFYFLRKK